MGIPFDEVTNKTLAELEKTQKEFWNIDRKTGTFLHYLIISTNSKSVLEIGTSNGYSGLWITHALKSTNGRLTTIEYYDKRQSIALENFQKCGTIDIVRPLQGSACEILEALSCDEIFDFVFIDANKSEYVKYFELIKPHLAPNALVTADNITTHPEKVQTFIDAIAKDSDFKHEIINLPGGLLIAYKNAL